MQDDDITIYGNFTACPYPIGFFYKKVDGELIKHPKGCGRWDCPYCGERKKRKLLDRIARYFAGHPGQARFLTLTLGDGFPDEHITEAWNRLKASLRKYGIRLGYIWVKEFTKRGRRHMHVIINRFIPKVLVEKLWRKATLGTSFKVSINRRPIRSAAGYLSKYITKDVQHEARYKRGERRYGCSRDMPTLVMPSTGEWRFEMDYELYYKGNLAILRTMMGTRPGDPPADTPPA